MTLWVVCVQLHDLELSFVQWLSGKLRTQLALKQELCGLLCRSLQNDPLLSSDSCAKLVNVKIAHLVS